MPLMDRNCDQCGTAFSARPDARFCSKSCAAKGKWRESPALRAASAKRSKRVQRSCQHCGQQFLAKRDQIARGKGRFCSRRCVGASTPQEQRIALIKGRRAHNWAQVSRSCQQCDRQFLIPPSRTSKRVHCSMACRDLAHSLKDNTRYKRIAVEGRSRSEHRVVMERYLGRQLERWEHVDHINRNKRDNRIENLRVVDIHAHGSISSKQRGVPYQLDFDGYR